jgi:8-oxo-dGTP pyrophosphatase MutT (NUDIX family)
VVALLYPSRGEWYLPLILRPASMNHHARQIGLPGGGAEPGESAEQCALRELEEELAVRPDRVDVLGQLAPIFVFASNFHVTPYVAMAWERPEFQPNPSEVEGLLEVPLEQILDRARWGTRVIKRGRLEFRAPSFVFRGRHIWGATGLILDQLSAAIGSEFRQISQQ